MIEVRTVLIPKTCKCEVKYYIEAEPKNYTESYFTDLFPFAYGNKYFETREEAEKYLDKINNNEYYFDIKEKITPIV